MKVFPSFLASGIDFLGQSRCPSDLLIYIMASGVFAIRLSSAKEGFLYPSALFFQTAFGAFMHHFLVAVFIRYFLC